MPTEVKENYLKALFFLDQEDSQISVTELSQRLQVSKPTASNMVKRLEELGWVDYKRYKPLRLTEKGRRAAAQVIRKHRLTEMFLYEIMNFGWEEVHEIAEQMEHIDSDVLFARMDEMLDYPSFDPHGSPIPDHDGRMPAQRLTPLIHIESGTFSRLISLTNSNKQLLLYLNQIGIELGVQIELQKIEPFDESCTIRVDGGVPQVISRKVAESLMVEVDLLDNAKRSRATE